MGESMQYASGYALDLYCRFENDRHSFREFPITYTGETFVECARQARHDGWKIDRKARLATCPKCTGGYAALRASAAAKGE